jgi:malate synthase
MDVLGRVTSDYAQVLTPEALEFVEKLQHEFGNRRLELLAARKERQAALNAGKRPDFLPSTQHIRSGDWKVSPIPADLEDRRVEITGPTDRKMMINALNSGASVFMADFEDANSPTWDNMIQGQINVCDAVEGTISFQNPDGKAYRLNDRVAVLNVRPRGWHLPEKHLLLEGQPISASLFDFGLFFFHNARRLLEKGSGPYFYLPKLESHLEARLWNDVFSFAQDEFHLPRGTIKATVLIETILAAFEMDEILYELREHITGLNAGRWDYIFSIIKKFSQDQDFIFPDRAQISMTVPFMRAYTELLVKTCHRRGAHAIGGMAAFIPSRKDPQVNEAALAKVREDKLRESSDGFDGTWVAHPDLVPVARQVFDDVLGQQPNQKDRLRQEVQVTARDLLDFHIEGGQISEAGLRLNINVGLQYLDAWLSGSGAVAIFNLMEDAATAEISRAQVWQWLHRTGAIMADGQPVTTELYRHFCSQEMEKIRAFYAGAGYASGNLENAARVFDQLATSENFIDFLTLKAYEYLD